MLDDLIWLLSRGQEGLAIGLLIGLFFSHILLWWRLRKAGQAGKIRHRAFVSMLGWVFPLLVLFSVTSIYVDSRRVSDTIFLTCLGISSFLFVAQCIEAFFQPSSLRRALGLSGGLGLLLLTTTLIPNY